VLKFTFSQINSMVVNARWVVQWTVNSGQPEIFNI